MWFTIFTLNIGESLYDHKGSIGMDSVISEWCYKGTISQKEL